MPTLKQKMNYHNMKEMMKKKLKRRHKVLRKRQYRDNKKRCRDSSSDDSSSDEDKVLRKNGVQNEFKKGGGNVDHLSWSERRKLAEEKKEKNRHNFSKRFFRY